jgi:hypothetical protein
VELLQRLIRRIAALRVPNGVKPFEHLHFGQVRERDRRELAHIRVQAPAGAHPTFQKGDMIPLIDNHEFPDGHGSLAFPFRVGEQLFQPVQADRVLADLRHEAQAAAPDDPSPDFCGSAMPIGRLPELFEVHGGFFHRHVNRFQSSPSLMRNAHGVSRVRQSSTLRPSSKSVR